MIIDLNKIKRSFDKDDLEENSLIIAEQLPGDVLFADMSSRLTAVFKQKK